MSVKPVAWMTEDGRVCEPKSREGMPATLQGTYSTPLYDIPAPELAEALQNLVRAYEAVVRGEVGNVGEKANPEFYAAVSLLARITPK